MSGAMYFIIAYVMWGLLPIFWKQLQTLNSIYILMVRVVFSMLFCLVLLLIKGRGGDIKKALMDKKLSKKLFLAGAFVTVNWGLYIVAVNTGHIIDASLAYYMNPIFTILIGFFFFKEPIAKIQWLATAVAFTGVLISIFAYGKIPYYAIAIAISFSIYGGIKKDVDIDSIMSVFMETLFITPIALIYIIYAEVEGIGAMGNLESSKLFYLPLSGVITAIPLLLFGKGVHEASLSLAGILMYLNPSLQLLLGVFMYNEPFTKVNAVTFGFVWVAVVLFIGHNLTNRKKKRQLQE